MRVCLFVLLVIFVSFLLVGSVNACNCSLVNCNLKSNNNLNQINTTIFLRATELKEITKFQNGQRIKLQGTIKEDRSLFGYVGYIVKVEKVIQGPKPCSDEIDVGMIVAPGCSGHFDPDIKVGDRVEVYGEYIEFLEISGGGIYCGVDICPSWAYIKKINPPPTPTPTPQPSNRYCCPVSINLNKKVFYPGDTYDITIDFGWKEIICIASIGSFSYEPCTPKSFKVYLIKPNGEEEDITYKFTKIERVFASGPAYKCSSYEATGKIDCVPGKWEVRVEADCCDLSKYFEVKAGWVEIKSNCGLDIYIDGHYYDYSYGDKKICLKPGWHKIEVKRGSKSKVYNVYVENNEVETINVPKDFCIEGKPDLIVDSIWTDKKPKIGENFKIYVKVKNIGKKDASKFYVLIEFCGKKYTIPINYLSAGGSKTVSTNTYCNKCNTKIKVTVDYNDKVGEENEYNNYKEKSINLACPNLVVDSISYSPKSPEEDKAIKISIVVKNRGDAAAPQSELKFTIDDKVEVETIPSLDPHDSYTVTKETTLSRGKHEIWAKADYRNEITESNEFDNTKVIYIDVKRKEPKVWIKSGYTSQGVPYFDLHVDYLPGKDLKLKSDVSNKVEEPYSVSGEEYVFELDGFVCNSGLCTGLLYMGDVKFTIYDGSEPIKSFTFTLDRYNQLELKKGFYIDLSEPEMVEVNGKIYTAYPIYIDNKISKGSKLWFSPTKDKSLLKKIVLTASLQDYLKNEGVRDVLKDQLKELADKYDFMLSQGFTTVKVAEFVRNTAAKLLLKSVWGAADEVTFVIVHVEKAMKTIMKNILEEFVALVEENIEDNKDDKKIKELIKTASKIELRMNLRVSKSYARDAIKMLDEFDKKDKEDKSWVLDYDTAWDFCNYYEKGVAYGAYNYYLLYHVYLPSGEPIDQLVDVCKDLVLDLAKVDPSLEAIATTAKFKEAVDDAANFAASMLAFKKYWNDEAIDKVHSNIVNVKPAAIKVKNQYGVVTISVDLPTDKAKVKIFGYLDESFIDYRIGDVKDYNIYFGENDEYVSYTCTVNSRNAEILELEFDKSNFGNGDYPLRIEMMRVNDLDGYPILCVVEYEV